MKKLLVVYDANILIDFCKLNLIQELFLLGYTFCTVDAVWNELREEQQAAYTPYILSGIFMVEQINETEMEEVLCVRMSRPQLSFPDCTALVYAKNRTGILLTSDKNLRSTAQQNKVAVRGHLWIFDELHANAVLTGKGLCEKLEELCVKVNPRLGLPKKECEERKQIWSNKKL